MPKKNVHSELVQKFNEFKKEQERYKTTEATLRVERDRAQKYLDIVRVMIVALNTEGKITLINQKGCRLLGWSEAELIGKDWFRTCLPQPEGLQQVYPYFQKLMSGELDSSEPFENHIITRKEKLCHIVWQNTLLRDETGHLIGTLSAGEDITERRFLEQALRKREERYRLLFQNLTIGFALHEIIVDEQGKPYDYRFLDMNSAYEKTFRVKSKKFLGRTARQVMPDIEPLWIDTYGKVALTRESINFEKYVKTFEQYFAITVYCPKPFHFATIIENITQRKLVEAALRKSRKELEEIFSTSFDLICIVDIDNFTFMKINRSFTRILGYARRDLLSKSFFTLIHPDDVQSTRQVIKEKLCKGRSVVNFINRYRCKSTGYRWIEWVSHPVANRGVIFAFGHDITERIETEEKKKRLELQLRQVHRLEAMGTLASGIAHDFNNLLTGIQGRISLLALDFEPDSPESEHIAAIEKYICAATGLTRQLLGATHKGKYETASIDVNQVAQSSFKIFGRANKGVSLNEKLCETPLIIDANKGQIEQVFLNIYLNAAQAMPNGGELFLETTLMEIKGAYCKVHQVEQGAYVKISITDTGIGMDNDIRQRVFDPFFTTKERRRGTGLGLASAYGIVKNHGGMITVYSELGHGTTFNIYLPVSNRTVEKEFFPKMMICQGSESILLVDDEKIILDVAKNMLVRLGYCVFVANGGQEALRIISEQGNVIDLVILDLIMPKMDGRETFRRIRKLHPKIPILLSSGYAVNGQAETLMREGCNGFIQKPYSINELSQKVRRILNEIKVKTDSRY